MGSQVSICLLGIWSMRMDRRERIESGVGSERRPVSVVAWLAWQRLVGMLCLGSSTREGRGLMRVE